MMDKNWRSISQSVVGCK